jgi:hypothetical protein
MELMSRQLHVQIKFRGCNGDIGVGPSLLVILKPWGWLTAATGRGVEVQTSQQREEKWSKG